MGIGTPIILQTFVNIAVAPSSGFQLQGKLLPLISSGGTPGLDDLYCTGDDFERQ